MKSKSLYHIVKTKQAFSLQDALMVNSDLIVPNPVDSALRRNNVISLTVPAWRDVIVDILEVYVFKVKISLLVKHIILTVTHLHCTHIRTHSYTL